MASPTHMSRLIARIAGSHMHGIGALPLSCLQPPSLLTPIEQRVEKQMLGAPFDQPFARIHTIRWHRSPDQPAPTHRVGR
ncbi:MAG: hypothetical protein J2P36_15145 [Ktedonobacteraceae bacterium]|nr:hypothetical protein [Ktedonobacteraceae bacterium]